MNKHKMSMGGITTIARKPDEDKPDSPDAGIEAAASDLINAIHSKDIKAVTAALKAVFQLMDSPEDESMSPPQETI